MTNIKSSRLAAWIGCRLLVLICVAIALSSCTSAQHSDHRHLQSGEGHYDALLHESHEHRIVGDGDRVLITNTDDSDTGASFAEEYCLARGKSARMQKAVRYVSRRRSWASLEFVCVERHQTSSSLSMFQSRQMITHGICWSGMKVNRSFSFVQIMQIYS